MGQQEVITFLKENKKKLQNRVAPPLEKDSRYPPNSTQKIGSAPILCTTIPMG